MDVSAIASLLPHRYPFLLVDRVVELAAGDRIVALKNVTVNEPFFVGHFPQRPLMPGVLICEALVQAGGILARASVAPLDEALERPANRLAMLTGLDRARFRRQVSPGDQLRLEVAIQRRRGTFWKMEGKARVDGKIVAELEFTVADVVPDDETPA